MARKINSLLKDLTTTATSNFQTTTHADVVVTDADTIDNYNGTIQTSNQYNDVSGTLAHITGINTVVATADCLGDVSMFPAYGTDYRLLGERKNYTMYPKMLLAHQYGNDEYYIDDTTNTTHCMMTDNYTSMTSITQQTTLKDVYMRDVKYNYPNSIRTSIEQTGSSGSLCNSQGWRTPLLYGFTETVTDIGGGTKELRLEFHSFNIVTRVYTANIGSITYRVTYGSGMGSDYPSFFRGYCGGIAGGCGQTYALGNFHFALGINDNDTAIGWLYKCTGSHEYYHPLNNSNDSACNDYNVNDSSPIFRCILSGTIQSYHGREGITHVAIDLLANEDIVIDVGTYMYIEQNNVKVNNPPVVGCPCQPAYGKTYQQFLADHPEYRYTVTGDGKTFYRYDGVNLTEESFTIPDSELFPATVDLLPSQLGNLRIVHQTDDIAYGIISSSSLVKDRLYNDCHVLFFKLTIATGVIEQIFSPLMSYILYSKGISKYLHYGYYYFNSRRFQYPLFRHDGDNIVIENNTLDGNIWTININDLANPSLISATINDHSLPNRFWETPLEDKEVKLIVKQYLFEVSEPYVSHPYCVSIAKVNFPYHHFILSETDSFGNILSSEVQDKWIEDTISNVGTSRYYTAAFYTKDGTEIQLTNPYILTVTSKALPTGDVVPRYSI